MLPLNLISRSFNRVISSSFGNVVSNELCKQRKGTYLSLILLIPECFHLAQFLSCQSAFFLGHGGVFVATPNYFYSAGIKES